MRIAGLLETATKCYATKRNSVWLVAVPSGTRMRRCEKYDPKWGEISDGVVSLSFGGIRCLGDVNLGEHGAYTLLVLSDSGISDELDEFSAFAADAGAALVATPPAWGKVNRAEDPPLTWAVALMFWVPSQTSFVRFKGHCRVITQPWGASVVTLRDWDLKAPSLHEDAPNLPTEPASPVPAAEATGPDRPPDGPESGCWLWWKGKRHDIPKGVVYRLIAFMWGRSSAAYDDLEGPVFEDPVQPGTIRARTSETNGYLVKLGIPWRLKPDAVSRFLTKQPTV